ncbi:MAG: peptide deformylase [Candidatus Doudnabacteria bacterium]
MNLPIILHPNKILRTKTKKLKFPLSPADRKLIKDMLDTVKHEDGIGLAAPQVNQNVAMVVINLESMGLKPFVLLNPEVLKASKKKNIMEEGCLSIPGVFGMVSRPEEIEFEAQDIDGNKFGAKVDGMLSKVIQHEIDHINGILIIDKIKKYTQGKELLK